MYAANSTGKSFGVNRRSDGVKVHTHVYKVVAKAELNLEVENEVEATKEALKIAKRDKLVFGKSDCQFIALPFKVS